MVFIDDSRMYKDQLRIIKKNTSADEHNRKKMEEKMNVTQKKYEEICTEHSVKSTLKNTSEVLKMFYPEAEIADSQYRKTKGDQVLQKMMKFKQYDKKKFNLFDQLMQSNVQDLEKGNKKFASQKEHIKLKEHRYLLNQEMKAYKKRNMKEIRSVTNFLKQEEKDFAFMKDIYEDLQKKLEEKYKVLHELPQMLQKQDKTQKMVFQKIYKQ